MKIAWCEQSGLIQDRHSLKSELIKNGIDFFRFNWKHGTEDQHSNVFSDKADKLSWSKGRELLYSTALLGDYDYYIFVDDDLQFDRPIPEALYKIKEILENYRPSILTIRSDKWQERRTKSLKNPLIFTFVVDLQFQCLEKAVASKTFPVEFDGGWGTLWYPMLWCDKKRKPVINIRDMKIKNLNRTSDGNYGGIENKNPKEIWFRSRKFMSIHVRLLSSFFDHQKIIIWLNFIYGLCPAPSPQKKFTKI